MDFELDWNAVAVASLFWIIGSGIVWKTQVGGGYPMSAKIILTIAFLPLCYFITQWQLNR